MENWGYGLGKVSPLKWYDLHQEARCKANSWKVSFSEAIYGLIVGEQLRRLGLHGMAGLVSTSPDFLGRDRSRQLAVRELVDAELRQRAWMVAALVWRTRLHLLWLLGAGALLGAMGLV